MQIDSEIPRDNETIVVTNSFDVETGRLPDTALTKEDYERMGGVVVSGQKEVTHKEAREVVGSGFTGSISENIERPTYSRSRHSVRVK